MRLLPLYLIKKKKKSKIKKIKKVAHFLAVQKKNKIKYYEL